jgi:hypothetical protein
VASGLKGEVPPGRIGFGERHIAGINDNDGYYTTPSDCVDVQGGIGEVACCHVRSVLMKHVQTGYIAYCSRGFWN